MLKAMKTIVSQGLYFTFSSKVFAVWIVVVVVEDPCDDASRGLTSSSCRQLPTVYLRKNFIAGY
jgi:hypothetical protein